MRSFRKHGASWKSPEHSNLGLRALQATGQDDKSSLRLEVANGAALGRLRIAAACRFVKEESAKHEAEEARHAARSGCGELIICSTDTAPSVAALSRRSKLRVVFSPRITR